MKQRKTIKRSKLIIPIAVLAIILTAITVVLANNKKKIEARATAVPQGISAFPVKIARVEEMSLDNSLELTGSFKARQTLPLIAEAQGSVIQLNIREGEAIKAGQVIARIDPTTVQSNLATAHASYNNAVKNKERFQRLVEAGAISQKQYEDVALNVENARANMNSIQQQMKYTIIHSPMSGIAGEVKVEKGSFATPGMQLGSVIDISRLKMVVKVDERDVIRLRQHQPVSIKAEVYPGQVFNGTVSLIGVQADAGRKYNVEIEIANNSNCPLKAGMFGTAQFNETGADHAKKLFIPRQAIVGSIQHAQVFLLNRDSTVTLKNIEVRNTNGDQLIVLTGITQADEVITSGQINLQPGTKVRVVK